MAPRLTIFGHGSDEPDNALNSRRSFERLAHAGAQACELDVRRTADDALIVYHDPHLPDGRAIRELPFAEIGYGILRLEEALNICAGMLVNIEIKNYSIDPGFDADERVTDRVLDLLQQRGGVDRVIISSFGMDCLNRVRMIRPDLLTAMLLFYPGDPNEQLDPIVAAGHPLVHPYEPHVDASFMAAAHARSLIVNAWTVRDDDQRLQRLIDLGVDGIITARSEAVERLLKG
ncbi:MAG: hypothetical protein F2659_00180 [Actinobacteria bacterium]|uniref:Unannotated protein n=1 Tax=freshwater metagenome TaxID=449393 RepID=A0A6J6N1K6_9ZZZZ|nr:hypothetical protein [Actinomycetota bacterium]